MAEYISRDDLLEKINRNPAEHHNERCAQILEAILEAPAAEVEPVRRGEWLLKHIGHGHYWECSECHTNPCIYVTENTKFCPKCGARMDLGGAENG